MVEDLAVAEIVIKESIETAQQRSRAYLAQHGEPAYCGFAWCTVYGVRSNSKLVNCWPDTGLAKPMAVGYNCGTPAVCQHKAWTLKK